MEYSIEELVRIAKRENNKKRGYLVVNPIQGKHIPVSPSKAIKLFDDLAKEISNECNAEKTIVIGFAETATAIGAQAAITLNASYIQTTREDIDGAEYIFFSEAHSHATQQKLIKNDIDAVIETTEHIVFAEDELTTGNTIMNIVGKLREIYPGHIRFSVLSLLNGMNEDSLAVYRENNISVYSLLKIDNSDFEKRAESFAADGKYVKPNFSTAAACDVISIKGRTDTRRLTDSKEYVSACKKLSAEVLGNIEFDRNDSVLVIGTEEFMYPALFVGSEIEKIGCRVRCHSTTRSPAEVSKNPKYPLHTRYELASVYDSKRKTFIYDIGEYDKVVVITESLANDETGLLSLLNALTLKNTEVKVVRWC